MSSQDTMKQDCGGPWWCVTGTFIPEDHLLERILSRKNMLMAWKRVKANRGSAGIDNMSIADFPEFSESSYGFRPGRSAHGAVKQAREYIRRGCRIAVDMDLSKLKDQGLVSVKEQWVKIYYPATAR